MVIVEGASLVHIDWSAFWPLWGLSLAVPAYRAYALIRAFIGGS